MWLVRPAQPGDLKDILDIAGGQGPRMSSTLPKKEDALSAKIEQSARSFAGRNNAGESTRLLFVLEDTGTGKVQGVSGIDARAGNGQPFYNYRQDALIHASHELGVSRRVEVLYPSHALTDNTLLCSFAIRPALRGTDAFELLSRARMLFIAAHRELFTDHIVVEIQGVQTETGEVPFWDSLGRHFFNMDFETADQYSSVLSKTFIAELMPPNPIYVTLLSKAAREALGQPHQQTQATFELLQHEGFHRGCYLDIFDAGPVLEARTDTLKSVVTSHPKTLHAANTDEGELCLISAGEGEHFRSTLTTLTESLGDEIKVPVKTWTCLGKSSGDEVRITAL
ncbi:arginine N-succinyltransferase [Marinobacter orientalis]|uniref:Arginine N-succinyltransferase n=1 Tax=Marinobacter orientalis TaxID=1928859 RepID=A0A7Y0NJA2_9GAMM|nr:arginine N-succinyltransferase [Marinobacter orientalis]NMT62223.1 arginine N-succinyltransferase [Marinobacter orientalis]TGX50939.1 arginine N-succinyltransferase [Marinobacter orientalis]